MNLRLERSPCFRVSVFLFSQYSSWDPFLSSVPAHTRDMRTYSSIDSSVLTTTSLHIHRKPTVFLCLCSLLSHWVMAITLIARKASKITMYLPDLVSDLLVSLGRFRSPSIQWHVLCSTWLQMFRWQKFWQWSFQLLFVKQPLFTCYIKIRCFKQ